MKNTRPHNPERDLIKRKVNLKAENIEMLLNRKNEGRRRMRRRPGTDGTRNNDPIHPGRWRQA